MTQRTSEMTTTGLAAHVSAMSALISSRARGLRVLNSRMNSGSTGAEGSMEGGIIALAPRLVKYAMTAPSSSEIVSRNGD